MKSITWKYIAGLCIAILLAGCGGGDNSDLPAEESNAVDTVQISGAGIKGPLAFADVKIYVLDPAFPDFYDKTSPISVAITNQFAEINGLSVPRKIKPPYILSIGGGNGIDLNTGVAPVIDTLVTVITEDMLANGRPVFATPLTTLVFHMARLGSIGIQNKSKHTAVKAFIDNLNNAASLAISTLSIGESHNIDLLRSPLVINEYTADLAGQEQAVYHRAAIEAFAAKVHELGRLGNISTDAIIENLAQDIYGDGILDNSDNGMLIGGIDPEVMNQDPMRLFIPNTPYRVEDIIRLMEEERIFIGTNMGPDFLVDEIAFPNASSSKKIAATLFSGITSTEYSQTEKTVMPTPSLAETSVIFEPSPAETSVIFEPSPAEKTVIPAPSPVEKAVVPAPSTAEKTVVPEPSPVEKTVIPEPSPVEKAVESRSIVDFSVDGADFGSQYIGETSDPISLVLNNSGTAPLNILGVSISSGFIEANNCSDYVPAGGNCTIDIQFVPAAAGNITGKLTIISDAINSSDFIILSGTSIDVDQFNADPRDNIFSNNFINELQHTYSMADLKNYWGVTGTVNLRNAVDVVADPGPDGTHDNALRVFYAGGEYGKRGGSGAQWPVRFSGHDELYLAYDVFFEDDAEFVKGGKLPRLQSSGWKGNPGIPADGTDRWTAGLMWREDGRLVSYVYHANMSGKYGDVRNWDDGADGQIYLQPGQWHRIEVRVVMNTPGVLDGKMQGWFDGKLAFDSNAFMWKMPGGEDLDIGEFLFETFYGGASSAWAPSTDQHIYFDNFVVSTQPITH